MNTATELLHRLCEIGATVNVTEDRLVVRAGARRVPAQLVKCIRAAREELLAALARGELPTRPVIADDVGQTDSDAWWRREFHVRTIHHLVAARSYGKAEGLAWGDLQNRWHRLNGRQYLFSRCAGCGEAIGGLPALAFADGNRVHLNMIDCLIRYGQRWRGDATRALVAFGLTPPEDEQP
jgi:hypothetical protein